MASSKVLLLGLLAIVATAASVRVAHGYSVDGKEISLVKINGNVLCSSTGNPESGQTCPPLANLKVTLVCPNIPSVVAYTDSDGSFVCPVDTKTYNLLDPFTCYVQVQLPLEEIVCAVLSTVTGTLHAVPSVLAGVVDSALGLVANIDIGPWSCLA